MRIVTPTIFSLALFAAAAHADAGLPPETLAAIKAATVYVKIEARGISGSGSGFVIKTEGDKAYVVTNNHVVQPEEEELVLTPGRRISPYPGIPRRGYGRLPSQPSYGLRVLKRTFKNVAVTVVFQSGTPNEEAIRGEVLGTDSEQDLAVVKVSGVKKMPEPIDIRHEPTLSETMPIYTFGFPFGKVLATSKRSPAITVGQGAISSLRMDDDGNLATVQIDSALNPGNSGGPVVDAHGRLVGIAQATIRDSSGIGLAIPCRELIRTLAGRAGKACFHSTKDDDGRTTVHVEVGLIDPMSKIKSVALHYLSAKSLADKPKPTDPLEPLPGCRTLPLKIENQAATGEFKLKAGVSDLSILYQAASVNATGKTELTKSATETLRVGQAVASAGGAGPNAAPPRVLPSPAHRGISHQDITQTLGSPVGHEFRDDYPQGWLAGFEVGLSKSGDNDVVSAIRPIFSDAEGRETLGRQHGPKPERMVRVKAKEGYAVGAVTGGGVKADGVLRLSGFSVTFVRVDHRRVDEKDSYESPWVGGKGSEPPQRVTAGRLIVGIVGKELKNECVSLALVWDPARPAPPVTSWHRTGSRPTAPPLHYRRASDNSPPGLAAMGQETSVCKLPEAIDNVFAGGDGRFLFLHLPNLRKLAVFDVAQAKITRYLSLPSDEVLCAAGSRKLIVADRAKNSVERYDLSTWKSDLTGPLRDVGQWQVIALGYASDGPAMVSTGLETRFLDLESLTYVEPQRRSPHEPWGWMHAMNTRLRVRASADGSTFAAWDTSGRPCGIRFVALEGDTAHWRYEHLDAGGLMPSFDGSLVFTGMGVFSSDLKRVDNFNGVIGIPVYHPAFFLGLDERQRDPLHHSKPKLALYAKSDKRELLPLSNIPELSNLYEPNFGRNDELTIEKRVNLFPTAHLLAVIPETRDQILLRRFDLNAALDKAGIDYLYVKSAPPGAASPGSAVNYAIEVESKRGGVRFHLDSAPDGMTLSDDGKLHWDVPKDESTDRVGVIITITDSGGQSIQHSFDISIH